MIKVHFSDEELKVELDKLVTFLSENLKNEQAVIGVSGGLDSDFTARIVANVLASDKLKFFTVIQDQMELHHLENARNLAHDLGVKLHEIDLSEFPKLFISRLASADPDENFLPKGLLDPSRAKCSLRTPIISTYQDRGYTVIGTSNRTEIESGFFLPFGDGIAHLKPIAHLYKTQVRQMAKCIGTRQAVLDQPASAGFWKGETDLEDMAYWLYNEAPIQSQRNFSDEDDRIVVGIKEELSTEIVDKVLVGITKLALNNEDIRAATGVTAETIIRFRKLHDVATKFKNKPLNKQLF